MLRDPKVQLVLDEAGAEGVAVWVAAIIEMYTTGRSSSASTRSPAGSPAT